MRRRALLGAVPLALAGCLSGSDVASDGDGRTSPDDGTTPSPTPTKPGDAETPIRRTADGAAATFRVVGSHSPTRETASATFGDGRVTVTGTTDPSGCNRPVLASFGYDAAAGTLRLVVAGESPYSGTPTVECGNASYDYRCVVTVDRGKPTRVEVRHEHERDEDHAFTLER